MQLWNEHLDFLCFGMLSGQGTEPGSTKRTTHRLLLEFLVLLQLHTVWIAYPIHLHRLIVVSQSSNLLTFIVSDGELTATVRIECGRPLMDSSELHSPSSLKYPILAP
jgi:hypothetical protein